MKKILCLMISMLSLGLVMGQGDDPNDQNVVNGVLQHSPHSFMVLPQNTSSNTWVKCWYLNGTPSTSSTEPSSWTSGIENRGGTTASHRIVTAPANDYDLRDNRDCLSCYQIGNDYMDNYEFPSSWNSDILGASAFERQYMQLCYPDGTNKGQKIEYKFKVSDTLSVLLLNFSYVMEMPDGHPWNVQPYVDIRLLNSSGNQLLNLGTYPRDYIANGNEHAGMAGYNQSNWPYARFFVEAPGDGTAPNFQTPSTLPGGSVELQTCPPAQQSGCSNSSYYPVRSYPYTIVAFNLNDYIGQTVILRVVAMGCGWGGHWSYARFTAKMVSGKLKTEYCNQGDTLKIHMPWGFKNYKWYNGIDAADVDAHKNERIFFPETATIGPNLDSPDPYPGGIYEGSSIYHPKICADPAKPYYRCEVVSATGVPFTYDGTVTYFDLQPKFTVEARAMSDSTRSCDYRVILHNESKIGTIVPCSTCPNGVDTTWADLNSESEGIRCVWDYGDTTDYDYGFEPKEHEYRHPNVLYTITLHLEDSLSPSKTCLSRDVTDTISFLKKYKEVQYSADTVVTCEDKLKEEKYHYHPELFGLQDPRTTWGLERNDSTIKVNYTKWSGYYTVQLGLDTIKAWNGCDSIAKVKFHVNTPQVRVEQKDQFENFCDSAQVTLQAFPQDVNERNVLYAWIFEGDTMSKADTLFATDEGYYTVSIVDTSTWCSSSVTYRINPCIPNVFLPNAITPGDKNEKALQNDYLFLDDFVLRYISKLSFAVYARNGELIASYEGEKDKTTGKFPANPKAEVDSDTGNNLVLWDGKVKGNVVQGTYVYTLWVYSGAKKYLYKGKLIVM